MPMIRSLWERAIFAGTDGVLRQLLTVLAAQTLPNIRRDVCAAR